MLPCVHVEVTNSECKLVHGLSKVKKNTWGKPGKHGANRPINLLKRHMKNILLDVLIYEVLTIPGGGSRILKNCGI